MSASAWRSDNWQRARRAAEIGRRVGLDEHNATITSYKRAHKCNFYLFITPASRARLNRWIESEMSK